MENSIHFQMLDLTKFLTCSLDLDMGTVIGVMNFKMIFSFLPGPGKHFIGNTLCSSGDSVTQLIHIFHFLTVIVFYNPSPHKESQKGSNLEKEGPGN